ncbi:MAG: metalloregulator ArsR/SmtB family transcription factor [Beijerinckiaceae bacterium]|nr:metalloregulator ArsR/SmtB family transcription factor [Beijerinckiaceae bacterium]
MIADREAHLDDVYHALASSTRRRMMSMLAAGPRNIGEIAPEFAMSLASVSKHVKTLERAGLIHRRVTGRVHTCSLNADGLGEAYMWLRGYDRFWHASLDALEDTLMQGAARSNADEVIG